MRFVRGHVLDLGCGAGPVSLHLQLDTALASGERFDTILLLGNNLGLLAGERPGRRVLRKLARLSSSHGRILAGSYDPYDGASEVARNYHARNRERGKMGGVERLRVRYRQYATPWYDVLWASREEVRQLAEGTGWAVTRFTDNGKGYVAIFELAASR